MTKKIKAKLAVVILFMALSAMPVLGITWTKKDFVCPVCTTKNTFWVLMSYGSYVYKSPSKYQYIYFPWTDGNLLYSCKKCYLSLFAGDFRETPQDKLPEIRKALEGVEIKGEYEHYNRIPVSKRLEAAEKVYAVLQKDDNFWLWYYRVKGYHYAGEGNQAKADEARKKALDLATRMLNEKEPATTKKELWLISGAMKHFLGNDQAALDDLYSALNTKYENKQLDKEKNETSEQNLSALVKEYIEKIQSPQKPRLTREQ
jgi:hypothetical protein